MTIPRECKRLAEVDFPIAVVSKHAMHEGSIRHGHPKTLHLWWARRPLASSRAMLLALLLPDPCDPHCPPEFSTSAREALEKLQNVGPTNADLRDGLLRFIGDFANWDLASNARYVEAGRGLVKAAYPDEPPLVVDPFAGGGSIPLEALRLGCEAFASDLNPVACLMLKVLLEDIPRRGPELADELRKAGKAIKEAAERELALLYPRDPDGARPISYLWARTVRCETPGCGAEIPLFRSMWLAKKARRALALRYRVVGEAGAREIAFEVFEPSSVADLQSGTVSRAKATCPACHIVLGAERVRAQLTEQRGGANPIFDDHGRRVGGARLLAVVTLRDGEQGRRYRVANDSDYSPVAAAAGNGARRCAPSEAIPLTELRRISLPIYGVEQFVDMFTHRQSVAMSTLACHISDVSKGETNRLLALSLGKTADLNNAHTRWKPDAECPVQTLARHDIPMAWDFAEAAPFSESSGSFLSAYERTAASIGPSFVPSNNGTTSSGDACNAALPDESVAVWFTDPPYYDSVPYAHLSDFFYVWERRALSGTELPQGLCPKDEECVVDRPHRAIPNAKTREQFEQRVAQAMAVGANTVSKSGIGGVVFAHKTTEGWEALLGGMMRGGWVITGSWPVLTEMETRLNARENASLASSVHLVCRPRLHDETGDWADVLRELPQRVGDWMPRLQAEGVRGADLVFACVGPALEIYSRYARVETADGREVALGEYLEKVWEVVGRAALNQVLGGDDDAGALEEDARLVALFLWTLQSTAGLNGAKEGAEGEPEDEVLPVDDDDDEDSGGSRKAKGYTLVYDVVRRFAQPLGIHLEDWERRIIETKKGTVRLLPVTERAKQLFGEDGAHAAADQLEKPGASPQLSLFPEVQAVVEPKRGQKIVVTAGDDVLADRRGATTLDRLHAAMLLQASGRSNALRSLLAAEVDRGPEFLRLANSLSALYPRDSEEKRLIDAMLLAAPR